jgi:thiol-disulfide isomerase/thioredoxin
MRSAAILLLISCTLIPVKAQQANEGPTNEKAQKTYKQGLEYLNQHKHGMALDNFKKADKQDGGHCVACQRRVLKYAVEMHDWKSAESAGDELVAGAKGNKDLAIAHYSLGMVWMNEALSKKKDDLFSRVRDEMTKALTSYPNFPNVFFIDGQALAHLNQDDAAKAQFEKFVKMDTSDDLDRRRALRYISEPSLARARMAPAFEVMTAGGQRVSLDDFKGKVVLLDFWATWCGPCREALPHMREIAKKFQGQPLTVLSVSLDSDEQTWKDFIAKNGMSWPQYYDGGFTGPISKMFGVQAIPHTFTIDADGALQDEHIGDASIEGKLKKLVGRARELQAAEKTPQ